jgi:hypothetical protein
MATLSSPGVSVTVVDESFYVPAAPGTVPLIIVATAQNKTNAAGTGTATATTKAEAGNVKLLTSQKDVGDLFGTPYFETDASNNPVHAGERNEYGLQAAYSLLGVSNRAYVVRADLDLAQLKATGTIPSGAPADGQLWLDTSSTQWGVFEWNASPALTGGQMFEEQQSIGSLFVITDPLKVANFSGGDYTPKSSIGVNGQYAIVAVTGLAKLWMKKYQTDTAAGTWVEVGTTAWAKAWPTVIGTISNTNITILSGDSIVINTVTLTGVTTLTALVAAINGNSTLASAGITAAIINGFLQIYSTGVTVAVSGTTVAKVGLTTGNYLAPALSISPHYQVPLYGATDQAGTVNGYPTGSLWVKTTSPNLGANYFIKQYSAATQQFTTLVTNVYKDNMSALAALDPTGGGINLAKGQLYVKYNDDEIVSGTHGLLANFKVYERYGVGATSITSVTITSSTFTSGSNAFTISETLKGLTTMQNSTTITFTATGATTDASAFLAALTAALPANTQIVTNLNTASNSVTISHAQGGDIRFTDSTNMPISKLFSTTTTANFYADPSGTAMKYLVTQWVSSVGGVSIVTPSASAPTTVPADGQLWYDSILNEVDIMIHNGTTWIGYTNANGTVIPALGGQGTDPGGPIISATQPTVQSDGTPLSNGDLWINSGASVLEAFPTIYKYNYLTKTWVQLDTADQTSANGILFADARWGSVGVQATAQSQGAGDPASIVTLLTSNFLDFDAPDPALYPRGMLLWNTRRSGFNVKKYHKGYVNTLTRNLRFNNSELMTNYYPDRWVTESPNQPDGSGSFGHKAQRAVVLKALKATIESNQQIRDEESRIFNLIACPGYPEAIPDLVSLNYDRGLSAFIVGDTPARLTPDATTLSNWGNNVNKALYDSQEGLVTTDPYLGVFYPWGYSTDNTGNAIAVPPSHMMLRTIALSDNVSYPWFAPAGTRRGGITNASAVGYISTEGEFKSVSLNTGQRDVLAGIHVNPITYLSGTGLVCYGQYTRQLTASSLDRINVARLVIYLRRQFAQLAKPYVFEPNDKITRDEVKGHADSLLLELVGQRALYDYLVVCDTSNNTPARIDRSELWIDVAIEPVKAAEFIYIPLRLKNTGAIKGLAK